MSTDFYTVADATTGAPSDLDQIVDFLNGNKDANTTAFLSLTAPGALTATINTTSGNLSGNYQYAVAFVTGYWQGAIGAGTLYPKGNTGGGTASTIITVTNEQIDLSNIPIGGAGVVARIIYRTKGNGSTFYFLQQISDNTTTSWTDNVPDTSLGAQMPTTNTTGSKWSFYDVTAETVTLQSTTQPIVFPNLSAFPAIASSGTMIVVNYMPYVSNGTSWVDPMIDLMQLSTSHGGTADFYGATTLHGGVGLTVNQLAVPAGLTATNATSGTVGSYIAASTQYTYEITAISYSNTETSASSTASVTTGATAYPINLTWTNGGADVQFYNVYKGGDYLTQVAGTLAAYQDTGNTATTSQTPPAANQTGIIIGVEFSGNAATAATATNASNLGGIAPTGFLQRGSGAPNPQTVANPVDFSALTQFYSGIGPINTSSASISGGGQGAYIGWNLSHGETDFLNNHGAASGGWAWAYWTGSTWSSPVANLDESGNLTAAGSVTAASGQLGSASGEWTPASGTFNVALGTALTVGNMPSGGHIGVIQIGIVNPSAVPLGTNNSGTSFTIYDGTYVGVGYFSQSGGYLTFTTTTAATTSSTAQSTVTWGVS